MTTEWHEWRRSGLGASDAPVIMGVSPYKTINQLLKDKLFGERQEDNAAMKRGRELEDPALNFFMAETGYFLETQTRLEHPERNWMRATLDGYDPNKKIVVEVKSCMTPHHEVPEKYYPQLQHQMEVAGVQEMYYVSFNGVDGKVLKVQKDEDYVKNLIKKEEEFWNQIQEGCVDLSSDENWIENVERLKEARGKIEDVNKILKELKEEESFFLSQLVLFSDGLPAYGHGAYLARQTRKGSIDYKEIPELKKIDLEKYRKEAVSFWKVNLKDSEPLDISKKEF